MRIYCTFEEILPFLELLSLEGTVSQDLFIFEGHALDFFDADKDGLPEKLKAYHPGMAKSWEQKKEYFRRVFDQLLGDRRNFFSQI